jgi:hypothetical protein
MRDGDYTVSKHLFRRTMRAEAKRLEWLRERYFVTNPAAPNGTTERAGIARQLKEHGVRSPGDGIVRSATRTGGFWRVIGVPVQREVRVAGKRRVR